MSKNPVNIVGERFRKYVRDQIDVRQEIHGKGIGDELRSPDVISYLNGSNAFIKMASSVSVEEISRLTKIGFTEAEAKQLKGDNLAKQFVLFNGTSALGNPLQRAGVSNTDSMLSPSLYGTGGLDFGLQAMPGIIGMSVSHNNLGSIKSGEITLRANSTQQFNILELLYVRLGYTVLIEWGKGFYFDNNKERVDMGPTLIDDTKNGWFSQKGTTHLEFYDQIDKRRADSNGNYDAFFCKVTNFDWSFSKDGYYEIKLNLVSLGDVVESFKIGELTPSTIVPNRVNEDGTEESETNKSTIANKIYCKIKEFSENTQNTGDSDYVLVPPIKGVITNSSKAQYYVRLGVFLDWMESNVITHIRNGDSKFFPIININTREDNYMRIFKGLVSVNPGVCVIKNDFPDNGKGELFGSTEPVQEQFKDFLNIREYTPPKNTDQTPDTEEESKSPGARDTIDSGETRGRIMNIYLNLEFIKEVLESSEDKLKKLDLLSFLNNICSGINESFAGYVDIQPSIQNENEVILRDNTLNVRTGKTGETLAEEEVSPELKMYGYDLTTNKSNFVRDFNINTKISNDLATMITIGATANNKSTIEVSDFFNNLNKGLVDRFSQEAVDGDAKPDKKPEDGIKCADDNKPSLLSNIKLWIGLAYRLSNPAILSLYAGDDKKPEKPTPPTTIDIYRDYLSKMFGPFPQRSIRPGDYFKIESSDISKGRSALSAYIKDYYRYASQATNYSTSSSTLGFIPIDLDVTIDGLSGIRIWNQLVIDSKFLPQDYPEKVELVIKGVTHTIQDNQWTTTLSAITKPKSNLVEVNMIDDETTVSDDTKLEEDSTIENVSFYPPIVSFGSNLASNPNVSLRDDDGGAGFFGASRGGRKHNGIDLTTNVGEGVFSPIPGLAQVTRATSKSKLRGVKIIGGGKYAGIEVRIFYVSPENSIIGQEIASGTRIGTAVELSRPGGDYPEDVGNHVHFRVLKNGVDINPSNLDYSFVTNTVL